MPANEAIIVELRLAGATQFQAQARGAAKSIGGIGDAGRKATPQTSKLGGAVGKLAPLAAGAAVGGGLMATKFGVDSVKAFRESYKIGQQTGAVIKSTGGSARVTAGQVGNLATTLSTKTGIDDEQIQSGENMLLTFTKVRNEAGKGPKVFNNATKTLVDMTAALGTDPQKQAIQLGKALNDPIKGISALSRVGVTFDASQKKQIAGYVKHNQMAKAQGVILRELNKEFGGSAKAQATNADRARVAFGNIQESVGKLLAPALEKVSGLFLKLIPLFSRGGAGSRVLGQALKAAQPIFRAAAEAGREFLNAVRPLFRYARYLVPVLRVLAIAVGVALVVALKVARLEFRLLGVYIRVAIAVIRRAVAIIRGLIGAARGAWAAMKQLASTIRGAVSSAFRSVVSRARALVAGFRRLGKGIVDAVVEGIKSAPGAILDAIKSLLPGGKVGDVIRKALPGFQHGGTVLPHQRVQLVGEHGPELAAFRPGTRITPLSSSTLPRLAAAGGAPGRGQIVVPVYLNGREIARATAQDTADARARRGW